MANNTNQTPNIAVKESLQNTLTKVTELEKLLQHLSQLKCDQLQQQTISSQYLDLLATVMYSLNCVTHSYAHLKSVQVPQEFQSVKTYYQKVKEVLKNQSQKDKDRPKINKEVAGRFIRRNI